MYPSERVLDAQEHPLAAIFGGEQANVHLVDDDLQVSNDTMQDSHTLWVSGFSLYPTSPTVA